MLLARLQELFRRRKRARFEAGLFQQSLERATHQLVVVDDGDESVIPLSRHGRTLVALSMGPQSSVGMMSRLPSLERSCGPPRPSSLAATFTSSAPSAPPSSASWTLTASSVMPSWSAMSLFLLPAATRCNTSISPA
jgi:hypothetical protein